MASLKICCWCLLLASIFVLKSTEASPKVTNSMDTVEPAEVDFEALARHLHHGQTDDWKENHYKVYSLKGDPIEPEETLKLLEALRDLYAERRDKGSIGRSGRVEKLIEASKISSDKCNRDTMWHLNNLYEYNSIYLINLVPYLTRFIGQQFQTCAPILDAKLKAAIAKLPKETVEDVAALRARVFEKAGVNGDIGQVARDVISQATLDFIEDLQGPFDKRLMGSTLKLTKFHLKPKFKLVVVDLCSEVLEQLDEVMRDYEEVVREKNIAIEIDQDASNWLQTVRMCRYLTMEAETVGSNAIQMLFEKCHKASKRFVKPGPHGTVDPAGEWDNHEDFE